MNSAYELLQKQAEVNKQLYTLLRFACKCDNVTALCLNNYESAVAFLAAKPKVISMLNVTDMNTSALEAYIKIAKDLKINFKFNVAGEDIESTDLLYIDTPPEGNYRAMELEKYSSKVKKYIIITNTMANAHKPSDKIKLADGIQPIGLVFGINHFLQKNDNWFIFEHDDISPGITILINKDNVIC